MRSLWPRTGATLVVAVLFATILNVAVAVEVARGFDPVVDTAAVEVAADAGTDAGAAADAGAGAGVSVGVSNEIDAALAIADAVASSPPGMISGAAAGTEAFDESRIPESGTLGLTDAQEDAFVLIAAGEADDARLLSGAEMRFVRLQSRAESRKFFKTLKKIGKLALKAGKIAMKMRKFTPQGFAVNLGMKLAKKFGKKLLRKLGRKLGGGRRGGRLLKRLSKRARAMNRGRFGPLKRKARQMFDAQRSQAQLQAQLQSERAAQDEAREWRREDREQRHALQRINDDVRDRNAHWEDAARGAEAAVQGGPVVHSNDGTMFVRPPRRKGRGLHLSYDDEPIAHVGGDADAQGYREHSDEEIEDCMSCKYVWTQVEVEIGTTVQADEDVFDAFTRNAVDAERTPIFYSGVHAMFDVLDDMVGDYNEGFRSTQICENSLLCR